VLQQLHNICLDFGDEIEYEVETDFQEYDEQFVQGVSGIMPRTSKRDQMFNQMFG
jgi:hypothetical protein